MTLASSRKPTTAITRRWFTERILSWAKEHGRHTFPWQKPHTPYKTWISEIMLQQTQAQRVVGFFEHFLGAFPDVHTLSQAQEDAVFHLWSGLGYYTRAQNLLKAAKVIVQAHNGEIPKDIDDLVALPGIGLSTAGAIRSLGHGLDGPILDGNVRRVLGRFAMIDGKPGSKAMEEQYWALAKRLTPSKPIQDRQFNQGMMDLGATLCTIKSPNCGACPLKPKCRAYEEQATDQFPITVSKYKKNQQVPSKPRRFEVRYYLFVKVHRQILLEKRPPIGIWRNLWCPQEFHSLDQLKIGAPGEPSTAPLLTSIHSFVHKFSHFDLELRPFILDISTQEQEKVLASLHEPHRYLWYNLDDQPNIGIPSPVSRLLASLA